MSKESTIGKDRLQQYLELAPTEVNIMKLVEWLEIQGNGLFQIGKPTKKTKSRF